jgi:DNA-binding MarR family transcriptional regulator
MTATHNLPAIPGLGAGRQLCSGFNVHKPAYASRGDLIAEVLEELRLHRDMLNAAEESVAEQLGMHGTDARCLQLLARSGPATAGQLGRSLGLTTGAVTPLLDRLERSELVTRRRDVKDRRRIYVELTAAGRLRAAGIWPLLDDPLRRLVDGYSGSELVLIRDFLRRVREAAALETGLEPAAETDSPPPAAAS